MAKKKGKKGKKKLQQQFQSMTLKQLLEKAENSFDNQKARDAISILKIAAKKFGLTDEIKKLLFNSYLMREEQLRSKNMDSEADMVKKQALEYIPSIESISETDMASYVTASSVSDAFQTYKKYLSAHEPSLKIEQCLANHFIKGSGFDLIDKMDNSFMIKRDFEPIPEAVSLMNQGKWEEALAKLQPVPRISPFAPVRLFCRAMVCFVNNDDGSALKALSMIPDHFVLANVISNMKTFLSKDAASSKKITAQSNIGFLWEGPPGFNSYGSLLYKSLETKNFKQSRELIIEIADTISPDDPVSVIFFILEIIWTMVLHNRMEEYQFEKLIENILPKDYSELLAAKINLQGTAPKLITMAGFYISILNKEFPDPEKQKIAHAQILLFIVIRIFERNNISQLKKEKSGIEKYKNVMGIKSSVPELMVIEIISKSIKLDPVNKKAYEILVQLPRPTRPARNMVDEALNIMLKKYNDDPFPCLELASIYYENNAFRKAENILAEAMKRAPHDNRVIDRNVLALLISSDKNIDRKKFHLVERDIGKAEELDSKKIWPFIVAKKIVLKLVDPESIDEAEKSKKTIQISLFSKEDNYYNRIIDHEIEKLPLFELLKVISVLIPEIKSRKINQKNNILQYLEKIFDRNLRNVSTLSSSQIISLLAPLGKEFAPIAANRNMALMFLERSKDILTRVSDSEILALYDLIIAPEIYSFIKTDIKKRIKTANKKERILFKFYRVILQHLDGEERDSDLFYDIIDEVEDTPIEKELEAMSARMSKYAKGPLKLALSKFDFDIIDDRFFPPGFPINDMDDFMPPFPSFDKDDDDDMPDLPDLVKLLGKSGLMDMEEFEEETEEIIENIESLVDNLEIRGLPTYIIKEMRADALRFDPGAKREIESMAAIIDGIHGRSRLSKEAQLFVFGKIEKKKK